MYYPSQPNTYYPSAPPPPPPPPAMSMVAPGPIPWTTGLCDCTDDCGTCKSMYILLQATLSKCLYF